MLKQAAASGSKLGAGMNSVLGTKLQCCLVTMPDVQLIGFMRLAPPFGRAAVFTNYLRSQDLSSLSQIQDGGLSCRSRSTFQGRLMSFDRKNRLPHLKNFGFTCRDYCANEMIGSHFDVLILLFPVIVQHNCSLLLTLGCMVSL